MTDQNTRQKTEETSVQEQQNQIAALQDEVTRLTCELGECREELLKLQENKITG